MTRVVFVVDIDTDDVNRLRGGPDAFRRGTWLSEEATTGIKFGLGDALHLSRPVNVIEAIVTDPFVESVLVVNPTVPNHALVLSGRRL